MSSIQKIILSLIILFASFLRFYNLGTNPPGLYWDEAAFGYDAFSILKTGKDHHGEFLPLFFESFGDWKLPGYHYLLVPSIAVFGLNEFAVRFPSALFGTLTVLLTYFLVKKLFKNSRFQFSIFNFQFSIAHVSALFLAISPWHIQFSRGGFESTVGLFFVVTAVYFFILSSEKKKNRKVLLLTFSFLLLTFSMYTYHAYRIFVPILTIALFFIFLKQIKKTAKNLILPSILSLAILSPLILFTLSPEGKARAISQSAFQKEEFEKSKIDFDQKSKKPLRFLSGYLYNQPVFYSYLAFNNYLDHFSPTFLFIQGDQIGRHSQVDIGQIYPFEVIFLLFSAFAFKNLNPQTKKIMLIWLLLAPIPAIIVTPNPHAYRTLQMSVPLAFFSGLGAYYLFSKKGLFIPKILLAIIIVYSFFTYLHLLFVHYPKKFAADWQDGYKQMVEKLKQFQDDYQKIYITDINQVPYIYLLFFQQYDPQKYLSQNGSRNFFDKYVFISNQEGIYNKGRILYVAPSWEKVDGTWLAAADDSQGRHIYSFWEIHGEN